MSGNISLGRVNKIQVGVENISFDASHYTKSADGKCENLHGHTFILSVEYEGNFNQESGMVFDFIELKKIIKDVIKDYDHKLILPAKDKENTRIEGEFSLSVKYLDYPAATTEYIALSIFHDIAEKLKGRIKIKLYEGMNNYVVIEGESA
ncbi:6-carboxytetrahydropterin synthase [Fervidicoccus fontis]|uniref:6-carboxytetrahydropterin synthase n=1 Tax=Fervidicoccus fontis TaxID=683846 RepID=A0A843A8P7_9CREN|nr:6-carboxytetrahydropterin synthase [Fervidicoccus fontis]MBE9391698.1 6-carboxytetrahydropterin synthase [Fervidicoccus fontis]